VWWVLRYAVVIVPFGLLDRVETVPVVWSVLEVLGARHLPRPEL
jgi:hypothetical protein